MLLSNQLIRSKLFKCILAKPMHIHLWFTIIPPGGFAMWGFVYTAVDCSLAQVRKKEDPLNSIASGVLTGSILLVRREFFWPSVLVLQVHLVGLYADVLWSLFLKTIDWDEAWPTLNFNYGFCLAKFESPSDKWNNLQYLVYYAHVLVKFSSN